MQPGQKLGSYTITAALGSGGMGEVWRATDGSLGREVALKLLPEGFADDPERHARFEREARTLASLNHPGIATLYGLEHLDGHHVLVMELVEGDTLDRVLEREPMAVAEVIRVAAQIAEALEAAHELGIVHRDLKPANVMIRPDGTVKVLDFGLAKSWQSEGAASSVSLSPTITRHATVEGVILGTAGYMAPEQARGRPVDRRADIWAFGVVLWEMLTRRRLFDGETVSDVLAAVLTREVPVDALSPHTPPWLARLVARCLDRDPRRRLQWIGEARLALTDPEADDGGPTASRPPRKAALRALPWTLLAAAVALAGWLATSRPHEPPSSHRVEASILSPPGHQLSFEDGFAISPDGTQLAFVAHDDADAAHLWVRPLGRAAARQLPDTEGAQAPFWSPDGRSVGFFAGGQLSTVELASGVRENLAPAAEVFGATWGADDVIVFAVDWGAPLMRIRTSGGEPETIPLPLSLDEVLAWPFFLPDGRHFLYLAQDYAGEDRSRELWVADVDGGGRKLVLESNSNAQLTGAGELLWWQNGNLRVQAFDLDRHELIGRPGVVSSGVRYRAETGLAAFSVSRQGVLVVGPGEIVTGNQLVIVERDGTGTTAVTDRGIFYEPRLSPDGRLVAVDSSDEVNHGDIWVFDVERGAGTRVSNFPEDDTEPVWSPSGDAIAFCSNHGGDEPAVFVAHLNDGRPPRELVRADGVNLRPRSWASNGDILLFSKTHGNAELWTYSLNDGELRPYLTVPGSIDGAQLSPDARFVAYTSTETGRNEIYVASYPEPTDRWRVSLTGGTMPTWGPAGDELFFVASKTRVMVVPVSESAAGALSFGQAEPLMTVRLRHGSPNRNYDTVDGRRFLINVVAREGITEPLTVLMGWSSVDG